MSLKAAPAGTYYQDLRAYLAALEEHGKLRRFRNRINKDTELHPLVRLQFRGLPPQQRTGWLFERVVDARGRSYSIPVALGCLAASREVYALGMQCAVEEIGAKWEHALTHPLPPVMVRVRRVPGSRPPGSAPCWSTAGSTSSRSRSPRRGSTMRPT